MNYLPQSIQSVLDQTFQDFELIIVNDASTDHTREFLDQLSLNNPQKFRVIHHQQNKKLPAALNTGFRAAKGQYLTWISSDNNCTKNFLQVLYQTIQEYPESDFVYGDYYVINDAGELLTNLPGGAVQQGIYRAGGARYSFRKTLCGNGGVAAFLYTRRVMEKIGLYDEDLNGTEDWDYWLRIAEQNPFMVYVAEPLMYYRIHDQSMTKLMEETAAVREKKMWDKTLFRISGGNEETNRLFSLHSLYPSFKFCVRKELEKVRGLKAVALDLSQSKYGKRLAIQYQQLAIQMDEKTRSREYVNLALMLYLAKNYTECERVLEFVKTFDDWRQHGVKIRQLEALLKNQQYLRPNYKAPRKIRMLKLHSLTSELLIKDEALMKVFEDSPKQLNNHPRRLAVFLDDERTQELVLIQEFANRIPMSFISRVFNPYNVFDEVYIFVDAKKIPSARGFAVDSYLESVRFVYYDVTDLESLLETYEIDMIRIVGGDNRICNYLKKRDSKMIITIEKEMSDACVKLGDVFWSTSDQVNQILMDKYGIFITRIFSIIDPYQFKLLRYITPTVEEIHERFRDIRRGRFDEYFILCPVIESQAEQILNFVKAFEYLSEDYIAVFVRIPELDPKEELWKNLQSYRFRLRKRSIFANVDDIHAMVEKYQQHGHFRKLFSWRYLLSVSDAVFLSWDKSEENLQYLLIETLQAENTIPIIPNIPPMNHFIENEITGVVIQDYQDPDEIREAIRHACEDEALRKRVEQNVRTSANPFRDAALDEAILYRMAFSPIEKNVIKV